MRRWKSLWVAVFLAGAVYPVQAADCLCPSTTAQDLANLATYIFKGDVYDIHVDKQTDKQAVTFDIDDTFKGKPPESRLSLTDDATGTECATDYKENETYLVYARWVWGVLITDRCWGTKKVTEATDDDKVVGPGDIWKAKMYREMRKYCMGKRDTFCCLDSVKAMAAGSYTPEDPDRGCPDNMIPDRLPCQGSHIWCIPVALEHRHTAQP